MGLVKLTESALGENSERPELFKGSRDTEGWLAALGTSAVSSPLWLDPLAAFPHISPGVGFSLWEGEMGRGNVTQD